MKFRKTLSKQMKFLGHEWDLYIRIGGHYSSIVPEEYALDQGLLICWMWFALGFSIWKAS